MKRFLPCLLLLLTLFSPTPPTHAAPVAQQPRCRAFAEAANGQGVFTVCDDAQARFLTALERWGVATIGYPISRRYERAGFVTQTFQKAIMQARPDGTVTLTNIFDDLHAAGLDTRLRETYQTPAQLPDGWDGAGLSFAQVVAKRQALLDARPALRRAYFAASDPLTFFGLPTSEVTDMGNHYAIRLQRAVLQEWKETVPWARAGQVTIANGGDISRALGALPTSALLPETAAAPAAPAPAPQPASGSCDPSYPTVCIPPRSQVGDLDCGQISERNFRVLPPDPHGFDGDGDGVGCEH